MKNNGSSNVKNISSVCSKLSPDELKFVLSHSSDQLYNQIGELVFNVCLNDKIFNALQKSRKYKKHKSKLNSSKNSILAILETKSKPRRARLINKQIGSGVISVLATLLSGILPLILKK